MQASRARRPLVSCAACPACPACNDGAWPPSRAGWSSRGWSSASPGGGWRMRNRGLLAKPKPLASDAVTHDWTSFLGPTHNAVSTETRLSRQLPPPLVWEFTRGTGYASPAIAGERLVFLHRLGDEEIVECLHAGDGRDALAVPLSDRLRRSLRIQQRPAIEPGHRRRARVHGGRARAAALPRPRNREA